LQGQEGEVAGHEVQQETEEMRQEKENKEKVPGNLLHE
jgi:hypothetical protein